MNRTIRNLTCALIIASLVFFAGCVENERTTPEQTEVSTPSPTPVPTLTGHEQAGEPDTSYLGLAEVFKGKTGLNVSTTNIDVNIEGVSLSGFLVQPVTPGKYPGIVMIHEWWGLNDQVKSMADITAREGYVVLAIDLFKGNVATTTEGAQANIRNNPNNETIPKMQAAVKYLRNMTNVEKSKIASLGWCYGGGQSFHLGVNEDIQATVIYYGQVSTDKAILMKMEQPVLGLFGAEDTSIPVTDVREFERILKEQGTSVNISIYEGAGHGFSNPTNTQAFRKEQAVDAWNKTLEFLELNLKRNEKNENSI
ncbi:MAG: dienelactone hydrolase family protein [Candidatus Methanoperedens nitroreducens]|uniref:Dienelactone hydrolase family protein n=1 Tax=Candidatus Methanoperedens nitratireducens TaxID=1392998 RepID=A0A0P8CJN9_9EURY|nr:dienelactone hydrolase family protein [Candidatus Methanoperedens sp. BLZ2]KPQ43164.1 MAG: dienelactone hydrolase family protein [Candidatus Methanoperedens sp. BLZ1]MBZ0174002.1 dienelactone hydrolase family protein [Candidatus Methanoperedens nitroreducens]MCX9078894.1 dienelactone hydrolase family protein [Candidatus Methanoperedens sp.]MCX9086626.1 dienelactone hydrolase family protein [Candidatus Methanoperedens sp.]